MGARHAARSPMRRQLALRNDQIYRTLPSGGWTALRARPGHLHRQLTGEAKWSELPQLRGGYAFPDARGALEVADGATVLFTLTGMSSLTNGSGVHVMTFQTENVEHGWLNDVIAIGEGSIDPARAVPGHALLRVRGGLPPQYRPAHRTVIWSSYGSRCSDQSSTRTMSVFARLGT